MRQTRRGAAALVVSVAVFALGCNKGPAETALREVDEALAAARPDLEKLAPEELAALDAAARAARAELQEGHYTEALKGAQELPLRIRAAADAAAEKKSQLSTTWTALAGSLPGLLQSITARTAALAAAASLPRGMTRDALASARNELGSVAEAWTAATAAYQGGDVPRAVEIAQDVKARADVLAGTLGLPPAPAARP